MSVAAQYQNKSWKANPAQRDASLRKEESQQSANGTTMTNTNPSTGNKIQQKRKNEGSLQRQQSSRRKSLLLFWQQGEEPQAEDQQNKPTRQTSTKGTGSSTPLRQHGSMRSNRTNGSNLAVPKNRDPRRSSSMMSRNASRQRDGTDSEREEARDPDKDPNVLWKREVDQRNSLVWQEALLRQATQAQEQKMSRSKSTTQRYSTLFALGSSNNNKNNNKNNNDDNSTTNVSSNSSTTENSGNENDKEDDKQKDKDAQKKRWTWTVPPLSSGDDSKQKRRKSSYFDPLDKADDDKENRPNGVGASELSSKPKDTTNVRKTSTTISTWRRMSSIFRPAVAGPPAAAAVR